MSLSEDTVSLNGLIQKFYLLQEERAHTYRLFEEGHKIYIASAPNYNFLKFRQLVNEVTQEFKRISVAIISIEKQLRFNGFAKIADIVTKLQESEKNKLELSAKLQIAKQQAIDGADLADNWNQVVVIKQKVRDVIDSVNEQILELRQEVQDVDNKYE
ncbi:unnamed protein product [Medioppia subpectinata]|uniref:Uncharacterized protein n=1 Tax=Medioppia subpectinata TaxID=1979941 RepID=A0A7R9QH58_9ACAR|nr:unnamed protein product [Medioppia subpectinata]CAG2120729.1 unnamed protein product [Medioppia subpectinata]